MAEKGKLYIVSTPIGNLGDITRRAIETLENVEYIAAEDTRHSLQLLNNLGIKKKLVSFHEHSSDDKCLSIVEDLLNGMDVALITDAGTPIVSDPGEKLTKEAVKNGIELVTVPGACAAISALTVSALDARRFVFEGFIPRDRTRKERLRIALSHEYTTIIYESPHHLQETLGEITEICPDRMMSLSKELTKIYEETLRGTVREIYMLLKDKIIKGEFIIVLDGMQKEESEASDDDILALARKYLGSGLRKKEIAAKVAEELGTGKNRVYQLLIAEE
jgi:16S rRNA (cytidine1402-2'-O)-methyltransferase